MKETDFAKHLTQFLASYLPGHLGAKKNTQLSYRDSFSLLLTYCRDIENIPPEKLTISRVDYDLVLRFLSWLEEERGCKSTTRNQRLAAIHSFFSFVMVEIPQYMEHSQKILNIPMKKSDKPPLMYLPLDAVKGLLNEQTGGPMVKFSCIMFVGLIMALIHNSYECASWQKALFVTIVYLVIMGIIVASNLDSFGIECDGDRNLLASIIVSLMYAASLGFTLIILVLIILKEI